MSEKRVGEDTHARRLPDSTKGEPRALARPVGSSVAPYPLPPGPAPARRSQARLRCFVGCGRCSQPRFLHSYPGLGEPDSAGWGSGSGLSGCRVNDARPAHCGRADSRARFQGAKPSAGSRYPAVARCQAPRQSFRFVISGHARGPGKAPVTRGRRVPEAGSTCIPRPGPRVFPASRLPFPPARPLGGHLPPSLRRPPVSPLLQEWRELLLPPPPPTLPTPPAPKVQTLATFS